MTDQRYLPGEPHDIEYLFDRLKTIDYPDGLVPVPERISGTAFFPGGYGIWREEDGGLPSMPRGEVMVLGNDFGTLGQDFGKRKGYWKALRVGHELDTPTWRNLRPLLKDAGIPLTHCFFTNAYMGLRTAGESSTGPSPGATDKGFRAQCVSFLKEQLAVQEPRLILVLGKWAADLIASVSCDLAAWRKKSVTWGWKDLSAAGLLKRVVHFGDGATPVTVVALLHPSGYDLGNNLRGRRYGDQTGRDAELELLREACG